MDSKFTSTDKPRKWIIDRFEEHNAVLEDAVTLETVSIPACGLPANANPGDTLILKDSVWHFDHEETAARGARISELFHKIKQKNL